MKHTPLTTQLLADLRRQLLEPPRSIVPTENHRSEEVQTATAVA